jgi:hypothetical protein
MAKFAVSTRDPATMTWEERHAELAELQRALDEHPITLRMADLLAQTDRDVHPMTKDDVRTAIRCRIAIKAALKNRGWTPYDLAQRIVKAAEVRAQAHSVVDDYVARIEGKSERWPQGRWWMHKFSRHDIEVMAEFLPELDADELFRDPLTPKPGNKR